MVTDKQLKEGFKKLTKTLSELESGAHRKADDFDWRVVASAFVRDVYFYGHGGHGAGRIRIP